MLPGLLIRMDASEVFLDFGDGTKGKGITVVHRYQLPGRYEASLSKEDIFELVNEVTLARFPVNINYPPKANAGPDLVGAPGEELIFDGSGSIDPDGQIISYNWEFGDGEEAKGIKVQHAFEKPDIYTAILRVEDDSDSPCNFALDRCRVWINARPVAKIEGREIASPGERIKFNGVRSYDIDGEIISFRWDFGDGIKGKGKRVEHVYKNPGTYKVKLKVTDNSSASNQTAFDELEVVVNSPPVADAGEDQRASVGELITFDGSKSFDRDGNIIEFIWDFGDGTKQKGINATHSYEKPGRYWVTLTIKDDSGSTTNISQDKALVIINHPPVANANLKSFLSSNTVQFDGTGSNDPDGKVIKFLWDFGDGSKGKGPSPIHFYQNPGTYVVRLTVFDDSNTSTNSASDEIKVNVNYLPIADAGPDLIGAPGQSLYLDGSGSVDPDGKIKSFKWDFGDGLTGKGSNVLHRYYKPGIYSALLTVLDDSGHKDAVSFDEVKIFINQSPVAIAGKDLIIAPNETVCFDGSRSFDPDGKIIFYKWSFSDGKESNNSVRVCREFSKPGIYSATLTVIDNSQVDNSSAQDKVYIRVNHQPEADAGEDIYTNKRTVLLDGSGSTDADGDPLSYIWDFGDQTPMGRGKKVYHTYRRGGNYPVILTVDDGTGVANARSTSSIKVKINEAPIADAGGDRAVCAGKVVIFDGSGSRDPEGGVLKYYWDFGDGTSAWGVNPTKIYEKGGVYLVTLTVRDDSGLEGGDTGIDQVVVRVAESPVADAGEDQTVCVGVPVQFDGTGSRDIDGVVNEFQWDFGDSGIGGGPTPIHVYTKAGTYRVILTVTGDSVGTCENTDTDEMVVTVREGPVAEIKCPATVAKGESVVFDALGSTGSGARIIEWDWDFGDGVQGKGERCEHRYRESGCYLVTLRVKTDSEADCNEAFSQKQVVVNESPVAEAGKDCLVGVNEVITFDGSLSKDPDGVISSYRWDFGDGETGEGVQVRHRYQAAGRYEVILEVTDNANVSNSTATDRLTVTVNEAPKPVIVTKGAVCAGEEVVLSAKGSTDADGEIVEYLWDIGDGTRGEGEEVYHVYGSPGRYEVVLEVDDGREVSNSRAQTSVIITVNAPPIADAGFDRIVSPGEEVLFKGSASMDEDGSIVKFSWDFGDGSEAEGEQVTHCYQTPGEYLV